MAKPDIKSELREVLNQADRFLEEQRDLFGNIVYTDNMKSKKKTEPQPNLLPLSEEPWVNAESLPSLNDQICNCLKCPLGETRTKFVFGVGNPNADIMFIGEAPGADEDRLGEPFVGRAGQLFNKILDAIAIKREDVYICNILKCRPPNNRDPLPTEMETCTPYLYKQIDLVKPKFIVCLGRISAQWLLQTKDSLTVMREKVHELRGARLLVTYHPAALLRNESWKRPTWEDMKKLKKMHDESVKS
jgi:uracil-DNA glycosylase family 4